MSADNHSNVREQIAKGTLIIGQLAKDPKEALNIAAQAVAGLVRGEGAATFSKVLGNLVKKGEIEPSFPGSSKGRFFIQEMNDVLDRETRDEQKVRLYIELFIAIASNKYSDNSVYEAKKIWEILTLLEPMDIKVLATAYSLRGSRNDSNFERYASEQEWNQIIAKNSGLKYREFVEESAQNLKNRRLLNDHMNHDNYRLTPLALCLTEYLSEGERLFKLGEK